MGDDIKLQLIFFLGLGPGVIFFFLKGGITGGRDLDSLIYVLQVFLKGCSIVRFDRYLSYSYNFLKGFLFSFTLSLYLEYLQVFFCTIEGIFFFLSKLGRSLAKMGSKN